MDENDIRALQKADQIEEIEPETKEDDGPSPGQRTFHEDQPELTEQLRRLRLPLDADPPLFTPKSFPEQIQFYDAGGVQKLLLYINKVWRSIIIGSSEPTGAVKLYAGSSAPTGYLICDGSAVSRTTYEALFDLIGETYGAGNGSTTFNLPNLKGRAPVGLDSAQSEFDALGESGGAKTHTLTVNEIPAHTHDVNWRGSGSFANFVGSGDSSNPNNTEPTSSVGGGQAHNNLPPYLVLNFIIKT